MTFLRFQRILGCGFVTLSLWALPFSLYAETVDKRVLIPAGEYSLGSYYCEEEQNNADWCSDETPRKVTLNAFSIDKYEVTNADYRECFIAGVCEPEVLHDDRPEDFNKPHQPVVFVNWKDAETYCSWRDGKLPSEAQWEAAAQGQKLGGAHYQQLYATGSPKEVGKLDANSNGLYDMMGNVYEWSRDDFSSVKAGEEMPSSKDEDKVVKGGSWNSPSHYLRISDRVKKDPVLRYSDVGFRCIQVEQ